MPNLMSIANGNFTGSSIWAEADATAVFTATFYSQIAMTTSPQDSAAFQPGAVTVDGVAVKVVNLVNPGAATNKLTVTLRESVGGVDTASVTVNVSDLPASDYALNQPDGGWVFLKFAAPVLLVAATDYVIRMVVDSTSTALAMGVDGSNNWHHMLRTDTLRAPAAGDELHIMGEFDGASNPATFSTRTITMDETATTVYGADASESFYRPGLDISKGGTLNFGHAASTAYRLNLAGSLVITRGGTLTIGTTGNPIPRNSSAVLDFQTATGHRFGIYATRGATVTMKGLSRTSGKDVWACKVSADASGGATSITVDTDTGWLSGDIIGLAATGGTYNEGELATLGVNAGASTLTVPATTYGHLGTAPMQGEVILLTRNVIVRSTTPSNAGMFVLQPSASIDVSWVYFEDCFVFGNTTSAGSASFTFVSARNTSGSSQGCFEFAGAAADNYTLQNVGLWGAVSAAPLTIGVTTGTSWVVEHVIIMGTAPANGIQMSDLGGHFDDITVAGMFTANFADGTSTPGTCTTQGTPRITVHSQTYGLTLSGRLINSNFGKITSWKNGAYGLTLGPASGNEFWSNVTINEILALGNNTGAPAVNMTPGNFFNCRIGSGVIASITSFTAPSGLRLSVGSNPGWLRDWTFDGVRFGMTPYLAPTSNDLDFNGVVDVIKFTFRNCLFGASTTFANVSGLLTGSAIASARHQQTDGAHRYQTPVGLITPDAATYHTAAPSEKLAPTGDTLKLESGPRQIALNDGTGCTVTVWVRKDGSYNGGTVRLVQKADPSIGVDVDTVLDSMTVGTNTWEQLSGVVPAPTDNGCAVVAIDCDGTAGAVYVDDWAVS